MRGVPGAYFVQAMEYDDDGVQMIAKSEDDGPVVSEGRNLILSGFVWRLAASLLTPQEKELV